jgi:hypothetical protein
MKVIIKKADTNIIKDLFASLGAEKGSGWHSAGRQNAFI